MNRYFRPCRALCLAALPWLLPLPASAQPAYEGTAGEWLILGRNETARAYLDQRSARRNGDFARVYQLTDFTTAQWVDERTVVGSVRAWVEYDCVRPRARTVALEAYSEQMGEGRRVADEQKPDAEWEDIAPGGTGEIARRLVCGK
ncbi:MAG: hypothetical protein LBI87_13740 [Candidatus Accumulibacter sp.]|jgi:hypothetical protein|nr:hypothetical protein [Accumulibacter sp.]